MSSTLLHDARELLNSERETWAAKNRLIPSCGLVHEATTREILGLGFYDVYEDAAEKSPTMVEFLSHCLPQPSNEEEEEDTKIRIGMIMSMFAKLNNRKSVLMAAQLSLALTASGTTTSFVDQLGFYGLTVSSSSMDRIHQAAAKSRAQQLEILNNDGVIKETDLDKLPYLFLGSSGQQCSPTINRHGGVGINNGERISNHVWTDADFIAFGDNLDSQTEAKNVERNTDTNRNEFTVNVKAVEVTDKSLSETAPSQEKIKVSEVLPNEQEESELWDTVRTLAARILVNKLPAFDQCRKNVRWHIPHKYSKVMENASLWMPLDIYDISQQTNAGSAKILDKLFGQMKRFRNPIVGGDELTGMRFGKVAAHRMYEEEESETHNMVVMYGGLHLAMCLLERILGLVQGIGAHSSTSTYSGSCRATGNLSADSKSVRNGKFNKIEDQFDFIFQTNIVAIATHVWERIGRSDEDLQTSGTGDFPTLKKVIDGVIDILKEDNESESPSLICQECAREFIALPALIRHIAREGHGVPPQYHGPDGKYHYVVGLTGMLGLYFAFDDAIREGDGEREQQYLKFFLPILYQQGSHKYCKVILDILVDQKIAIPARRAHIMKWNSTVGFKTGKGFRQPNDFSSEYQNKLMREKATGNSYTALKKANDTIYLTFGAKNAFEGQGKGQRCRYRSKNLPASETFKKRVDTMVEERVFVRCEGRGRFEGDNGGYGGISLLFRSNTKAMPLQDYIKKHIDATTERIREKALIEERRKKQKLS